MCSFGSCKMRFEFLSQFRKVRNAFECFVSQVQYAFAKNQTRLAYEDKRDLYCMCRQNTPLFDDFSIAGHLTNCHLLSICPTNSQASQLIIDQ